MQQLSSPHRNNMLVHCTKSKIKIIISAVCVALSQIRNVKLGSIWRQDEPPL